MSLTLLPAIDVQSGKAVRLFKGALKDKTNYGEPLDIAKDFVQIYAENSVPEAWVHLVDLDAAFGTGDNYEIITRVVQVLAENGVNVELSGGIRDNQSLERAIKLGATRVNVGTAALEDPVWTANAVAKYGAQLAIGLDTRGETLSARGWTRDGGNIWDVMQRLLEDGVTRFVITDVTKDGTLQGPNTELLLNTANFARECGHNSVKITASGGISSLEDLTLLESTQVETGGIVESAIFGKALYEGKFTLEEALHQVFSIQQ